MPSCEQDIMGEILNKFQMSQIFHNTVKLARYTENHIRRIINKIFGGLSI